MSDQAPSPVPSRIRKTNAFASFVWLVPLIAFLVGGWLLFDHIRNTGPKVTLYLDSADGIEVNNTVVRVLSVNVGKVTNIRLREDGKGVELTAQLNADVKNMMRSDTQFWVVKPRIDSNGISGLNTLVSGSYIAFMPGKAAESKDTFDVADVPPISALAQDGLRLQLSGANSKMLETGAPVVYESFPVGRVESAKFDPESRRVSYTVFIEHPNDSLINSSSQFWLDSGIRSGQDMLKAWAMGARGFMTGRAFLYGLGAYGEDGVRRALELMYNEMDITMAFTGHRNLHDVDKNILVEGTYPQPAR